MRFVKYPIGTLVCFNSKHGESVRDTKVAVVMLYGNNQDGSGLAHWIQFADGYQMVAYPQELTSN